MKYLKALLLITTLISFSANALLEVNVVKSREAAFPIVVAPFEMIGNFDEDVDLASIIRENLNLGFEELATELDREPESILTFIKKISLQKKNIFVFSSIFTISFLFFRGIAEIGIAVFSIDFLVFLSCIIICEKLKIQK